jgi:hypothetical protein
MDKWFRDIAAKFALPASGEAFGNSDTVGEFQVQQFQQLPIRGSRQDY